MDVFLIRDGVIENVAVFDSLEHAQQLCPEHTVVERVEENRHLNIGDTL